MSKKRAITWGVRLGSISLALGLTAATAIEKQQEASTQQQAAHNQIKTDPLSAIQLRTERRG